MDASERLLAHSAVVLAPLLFLQGIYARAGISRLPEAAGPRRGRREGGAAVLRLLLLGESTVAGVGVRDHDEGLAGQTARAISALTGATIDWHVHAANGLTAAGLRRSLVDLPPDTRADLIVLGLGANDVFRLTGPRTWARELHELIATLRERCGFAPVMFSAMPPIGRFPGLPQPLRSVLGLRARLLDEASVHTARNMAAVHFLSLAIEPDPAMFCADGVHPSAAAYAMWGEAIAEAALVHLPHRRC